MHANPRKKKAWNVSTGLLYFVAHPEREVSQEHCTGSEKR